MNTMTERQLYWIKLISNEMQTQGILQERKPGVWRLRWREKCNDGTVNHRSIAVPDDEIEMVKMLLRETRAFVQKKAEDAKAFRKLARAAFVRYREIRRNMREEAPGGRDRKRKLVKKYDEYTKLLGVDKIDIVKDYLVNENPPKRGRPANPLPKY